MTDVPEQDLLAAELALGLLEGEDRAAALRRALSDPAFAAEVDAWRRRFEPLCSGFEEAPPPDIWPGIERRLGTGDAPVTLLRKLRVWQWSTAGTGAVAAALAAVLVFTPPSDPVRIVEQPLQLVVVQLGGDAGAFLAASYDPGHARLKIRAIAMPASRLAPELWVIPADGVPRSLGLVADKGLTQLEIPVGHRALLQEGATLAITMEPADGAPHAAPSSAPIAAGKISTI